eukprot:4375572-Karenia_brevis.AAC.1
MVFDSSNLQLPPKVFDIIPPLLFDPVQSLLLKSVLNEIQLMPNLACAIDVDLLRQDGAAILIDCYAPQRRWIH